PPMLFVKAQVVLTVLRVQDTLSIPAVDQATDLFADNVDGTSFNLFVDAADIFANDAQEKQQNSEKKSNHQEQGSEPLRALMEDEFGQNSIDGEEQRQHHTGDAQDGGCANRNHGEGKDRIGSEL